MFGVSYVVPSEPRRYKPLYIRADDANIICGVMLQLKAFYGVQRLSNVPLRESDLEVTWELLEGYPPLEFNDWNSLEPVMIIDPDKATDMVFRVWLDKGRAGAVYDDVRVFRTPTDLTKIANFSKGTIYIPKPTLGGIESTINQVKGSLLPTVTKIDIDSDFDGELDAIQSNYDIYIEYPESFEYLGHEVISVDIVNAKGDLVEQHLGEVGSTIQLSTFTPHFGLIWRIKPYSKLKGLTKPTVTVVDPKLHAIPLEFYPSSGTKILFTSDRATSYINASNTKSGIIASVQLPELLAVEDGYSVEVYNKAIPHKLSRVRLKANVPAPAYDDTLITAAVPNPSVSSRVIKRYDEIQIGG